MSTRVTIGICAKNSEKTIKVTIEGMIGQDFPHDLMKLVVVDDGSTDKTLSVVRNILSETDIRTLILSSGGKGLGPSRQIIVDNAEGDYLVFVDADVKAKKDFVSNHVKFMDATPSVGAAMANPIVNEKTLVATLVSMDQMPRSFRSLSYQEVIATGATIFRLKAIKHVGGFDTNIKGAGEDQDITLRIRESGWRLCRNSLNEVYHLGAPTTWKRFWDRQFWYGYGSHYRYHKYKSQMLPFEYFPLFALMIGFKNSCPIYKVTRDKKAFLLPLYFLLRGIARTLGFVRAHFDGYGHIARYR